ncbi:MAG: hypothetical protein ACJ8HU_07690 [Chthoniobacterales bacterium]
MPAAKKKAAAAPVKKQVIGTRVKITLNDTAGKETLTLETPGGQRITLSDTRNGIEIADRNGNAIRLEPSGITIQAAAKVILKAAEIDLNASLLNVDAAIAKFSGVVQCDTLLSNSVVSASYTPGAGNLM